MTTPFYLRYYIGHKGKFGHEFLEFEVREDGRVRYANSSHYKSDLMIRKEVFVSSLVIEEFKRIVEESKVAKLFDENWPAPDRDGKQELELHIGEEKVLLETSKLGSMSEISSTRDPEGLKTFHFLVLDIKCLLFSLINLHFRVKPV